MSRRAGIVFACLGLVGVVTIAAVIVFLSRGSDTPPPPGTDAGIAIDPSATDPVGVATSVMSGVYTWQPAVQDSPWDALHAQHDNLTGSMATAATTPPDPAPQPIPEWSAWARSGDVVTAVARPDTSVYADGTAAEMDGDDKATVAVVIDRVVQHRSGEITPFTGYTGAVDVELTADGWKVANYRLVSAGL
ncbi:hypothetical protein [Rhodococcoides fascians]|uniref:hypothetical protein n=1 Tax=Rhodococcoides fascians TaxID=1828 RepID=UPI00068B652F|nr:hypothetical protein [Rhodococcus fascians]